MRCKQLWSTVAGPRIEPQAPLLRSITLTARSTVSAARAVKSRAKEYGVPRPKNFGVGEQCYECRPQARTEKC